MFQGRPTTLQLEWSVQSLVRSAGSFRSEPTLAEVLAPTLCNSVVSLHVDLR